MVIFLNKMKTKAMRQAMDQAVLQDGWLEEYKI